MNILEKKKADAKQAIAYVYKRKYEEKLVHQQLNDPKTLKRERAKLEERLRTINLAIELTKVALNVESPNSNELNGSYTILLTRLSS